MVIRTLIIRRGTTDISIQHLSLLLKNVDRFCIVDYLLSWALPRQHRVALDTLEVQINRIVAYPTLLAEKMG